MSSIRAPSWCPKQVNPVEAEVDVQDTRENFKGIEKEQGGPNNDDESLSSNGLVTLMDRKLLMNVPTPTNDRK